jgi:hypothetical protein
MTRALLVTACIAFACASVLLCACERERVEVGESTAADDGDGSPDGSTPSFPIVEGGVDALVTGCGAPPVIGRCTNSCPTGYVKLPDGGTSCECCP